MDYTGTGNSLNARHSQTLKRIMDSLRYWVIDRIVDKFFLLCSTPTTTRSICSYPAMAMGRS